VTHWPPWKARNAAEQQEMIGAVVAELLIEDEHAETLIMRWDGTMATEAAFRAALYTAKASARRGNLEPLRRLLSDLDPELAEFINAPPRVRGQRRPRLRSWEQRRANAEDSRQARDAERVRAIWRREYRGRWKRHAGDGPSAAEIVAAYHAILAGLPPDLPAEPARIDTDNTK
jgi:hypothetical protein